MSVGGPAEASAAAREAVLREAGLADATQSTALDQLTTLAVEATRSAASFVCLVGEQETLFRSSTGLPVPFGGATSDTRSIVRHLLETPTSLAITDVRTDPTLSDAWEVQHLGAIALLAVPLVVDGVPLGALAVLDPAPRAWTEREAGVLASLAELATRQISLARLAQTHAIRQSARAERALVESENRYRTLVESAPDAILVLRDGVIAFANPAAVALTGATSARDLHGLPAERLLVPPFLKALRLDILRGAATRGARADEPLTRLDGAVRDVEVSGLPYLTEDAPAILLFLRDVTDIRLAEMAIRRQEAQLRLLAEQLPVLVWATDPTLRLTALQGSRSGLLPSPDPVGAPLAELLGSRDPGGLPLSTQRAAAEGQAGVYRVEWRGRTYDVHVKPLRAADGALLGTVGVAMDVSDQARRDEQLREAQHLAMVGQIAAGVAHEMNNILGTVLGLASALALAADTAPKARADLAIVEDAARRGGEITARLLGFARRGMYRPTYIATSELVSRVAALARGLSASTHVVCEAPPDAPGITGDLTQLEATLLNLCQNAVDAMPQGGTLTLRVAWEDVSAGMSASKGVPAGRWVRISIIDTGTGMSDEVRARAAEPFFTTKAVGKGAGLGLSMAYGVVLHHEGQLVLDSAPGRGTTVTIFLPAAAAPAVSAAPAPRPPLARVSSGGLVLVVDDDEWVRWSTRQLLEAIGYEVVEAPDGPTALTIYGAQGPQITAVLLDMRMPGMDGAEVLRRLVVLDPDVRIILCTGYERDQVSQGLFALGHVGFLGKPFTIDQLATEVAQYARAPHAPVPSA